MYLPCIHTHAGGISSALAVLMAGGCHVFLQKYSPSALLAAVQQHRVSAMIAVPTMLQDICALRGRTSCPTMQRLLVGAGAVDGGTVAEIAQLMPNARIQTAYGMTEAASSITFLTIVPPPPAGQHAQHSHSTTAAPLVPGRAARSAQARRGNGPAGSAAAPAGAGASQCAGYPAPGIQVRLRRVGVAPGREPAVATSSPQEVRSVLCKQRRTMSHAPCSSFAFHVGPNHTLAAAEDGRAQEGRCCGHSVTPVHSSTDHTWTGWDIT